MHSRLQDLYDLYALTPGRRLYALGQVRKQALAAGLDALANQIEGACAHDRTLLDLVAAWRSTESPPPVRDKDLEVDRLLNLIHTMLSHYASLGDPSAMGLRTELFPEGPAAHTGLNFVEQKAANERVLDRLAAPELKPWLATHGFAPLAAQLADAHKQFCAVLEARDAADGPRFDEVRAARQTGQELYLEVVATIISQTQGDPTLRATLLAPIVEQDRQVEAIRRQRRVPADVDPSSGELLEAKLDAEPEPDAQADTEPQA